MDPIIGVDFGTTNFGTSFMLVDDPGIVASNIHHVESWPSHRDSTNTWGFLDDETHEEQPQPTTEIAKYFRFSGDHTPLEWMKLLLSPPTPYSRDRVQRPSSPANTKTVVDYLNALWDHKLVSLAGSTVDDRLWKPRTSRFYTEEEDLNRYADRLFRQCENIALELDFLHGSSGDNGLAISSFHHDIRPKNILVSPRDGTRNPVGRWKISDFGMSALTTVPRDSATLLENRKKAHLITSYNRSKLGSGDDFEREDDESRGMKIWKAALATSAAPSYFPPFEKPETGAVYFDGALHMNCPAPGAVEEIRKIWLDYTPSLDVLVLVSLGTGIRESEVKIPKAIRKESWPGEEQAGRASLTARHSDMRKYSVHSDVVLEDLLLCKEYCRLIAGDYFGQHVERFPGDRSNGSNHPWLEPPQVNPDDDDNDDHFGFRRANCWGWPHFPDSREQELWYCCDCNHKKCKICVMPASRQVRPRNAASVTGSTISMWKAAIERTCVQRSRDPIVNDPCSVSATKSWARDYTWSASRPRLCHC